MHTRVLAIFLASAVLAGATSFAAELRIRPEARPTGSLVTLGDVAEIYAQDKEQVETLTRIELFPAPGLGTRRFLRVREILEILQLRSINLTDCRISGATLVTIHGPDAPLPERTAAPARPEAPPQIEPQPEPVLQAVAALRPVERGQVIQASDVQLVSVPARGAADDLLPSLDMAVGQEATRSFRPGQPLDPRGLRKPILVRRREPVRVTVFAPGVQLTAHGLALDEGAAGDWVFIETPHSHEKLRARVVGPKHVEMHVNAPAP